METRTRRATRAEQVLRPATERPLIVCMVLCYLKRNKSAERKGGLLRARRHNTGSNRQQCAPMQLVSCLESILWRPKEAASNISTCTRNSLPTLESYACEGVLHQLLLAKIARSGPGAHTANIISLSNPRADTQLLGKNTVKGSRVILQLPKRHRHRPARFGSSVTRATAFP